jgi:phage-related protein
LTIVRKNENIGCVPRTEVIFYQDDDQAVLVVAWLKKLPARVQVKCQVYLAQLEEFGHELRRPVADYLREGIYELRPSYQGVNYRMLYFFEKGTRGKPTETPRIAVVSHGFVKEGGVPDAEIDRAIQRKKKFEANPERHTFRPTLNR